MRPENTVTGGTNGWRDLDSSVPHNSPLLLQRLVSQRAFSPGFVFSGRGEGALRRATASTCITQGESGLSVHARQAPGSGCVCQFLLLRPRRRLGPLVAWTADRTAQGHLLSSVPGPGCPAQRGDLGLWLHGPHPAPVTDAVSRLVCFNVRPFAVGIDGAQGWLLFSLHRDICGDGDRSMGPLSVSSCFVLT